MRIRCARNSLSSSRSSFVLMSVVPHLFRSRRSYSGTGSPTLLAVSSGSPRRSREARRTPHTSSRRFVGQGCVDSQQPPRGEGDTSGDEYCGDVEQPDEEDPWQSGFVVLSLRRTRFSDFLWLSFAHRPTSILRSRSSGEMVFVATRCASRLSNASRIRSWIRSRSSALPTDSLQTGRSGVS